MAIGLRRKTRLDSRRENQRNTRLANGVRKRKERSRRDARMIAVIKASSGVDLAPPVQSWVAVQLGKPYSRATPDEIRALAG
ncbi:MAG: hypothetical protein ACOCVS_00170 [Planctomycetota bacterium]